MILDHTNQQDRITKNISTIFKRLSDDYSARQLKSMFGITNTEFENLIKGKDSSIDRLASIGRSANFSLITVLYGEIDPNCVIDKIKGRKNIIPQKYMKGAYTTRRVTRNILIACQQAFGTEVVEHMLLSLQTTPDNFTENKLDEFISTTFNADLLSILAKNKLPISPQLIGQIALNHMNGSEFHNSLKGLSVDDTYMKSIEEIIAHVEKSHEYRIQKITHDRIVIEKRLTNLMKDEIGCKIYSNNQICKYSIGMFESMATLSGNSMLYGREGKCIFRGDDCCEYILEKVDNLFLFDFSKSA